MNSDLELNDLKWTTLNANREEFRICSLPVLAARRGADLDRLPFSLRILLEAALRNLDGYRITAGDIDALLNWEPSRRPDREIAFQPGRVVLQDFTGVPALVDLAALRSAMVRLGGDPSRINPQVRVDLVIDHSVQVDYFGTNEALGKNIEREFERNRERYEFLKWGQSAFRNFAIVPPGAGIVHQVNLEYLGRVVLEQEGVLYPDSLVGTDSHTTMINGLGVVGWGVGGIEAEAVMLGQPLTMLTPQVTGFEITGRPRTGSTATDLVLRITEMLRRHGVVGQFVEFFGEGLSALSLPDRATIANMAPEYGATMGYFPVDEETLRYLRLTGRPERLINLVESYYREQGLFHTDQSPTPEYTALLQLDLGDVEPSLAGPKRPQDRITVSALKESFRRALFAPAAERGFEIGSDRLKEAHTLADGDGEHRLQHGSVVIAAITSCTNTSNPGVMLAAGILARNAVAWGLQVPSYVKTSLAPGSRVVSDYLERTGLATHLERLGFHTVGYGCTTCIGNSGPLAEEVVGAIDRGNLVVASVLSGNRNFEGRISPQVKANFLASPPLVVAYALAGRIDIDLQNEPLGRDNAGQEVYLRDLWPAEEEIRAMLAENLNPEMFRKRYEGIRDSNPTWNELPVAGGEVYDWNPESTYIQEPDFFIDMPEHPQPLADITGARVLALLGDSVTTDHISPAGTIDPDSPAGRYLREHGVTVRDFNSYGSRRGNDRVMTRGTFANVRLRNRLAPGTEGGFSRHFPSGETMPLYDAAMRYRDEGVPLLVLAGAEYGTGSSRDWAAKGTLLLGIRVVLAASYERIHRSNLVGMGVLPLQFLPGEGVEKLGLTGEESYAILGLNDEIKPQQHLTVRANDREFEVLCRLDSPVEIEYYKNGGILQTVLRGFLRG